MKVDYHKLKEDDERVQEDNAIEMIESQENPIQQSEFQISLKILLKEKIYEVSDLSKDSTVSDLKAKIQQITEIPLNKQRLIASGKLLSPESKPLSFFKIQNGSSIHLFPLPNDPSPLPVEAPIGNNTRLTVISPNSRLFVEPLANPMHFDPSINMITREVKLWCYVLFFVSGMSLFNNISYFLSTGSIGDGILDTVVFLLDSATSAAGILVSMAGIKSLRTLSIEDISKYVLYLGILACVSMILRVLSVIDVVYIVKAAVKESKKEQVDNPDPSQPILSNKTVVSMGIQATILGLVILYAWFACFQRARSFQNAVQSYNSRTPQEPQIV